MAISYTVPNDQYLTLPEADYAFAIGKPEYEAIGDSNRTAPRVKIPFKVTQGKFKGMVHSEWLSLSEKALWRFGQLFLSVGMSPGDEVNDLEDMKELKGLLFKKVVVGTIEHDEYGDKVSAKIVKFRPFGGESLSGDTASVEESTGSDSEEGDTSKDESDDDDW